LIGLEKELRAHRLLTLSITMAALVMALAAPAMGASKNCWGVVTSQRAVAERGIGTHSSSFAGEPRLGLGNVARLFNFDQISDLGALLATLDGIEATACD
jgi:hypothetical protein